MKTTRILTTLLIFFVVRHSPLALAQGSLTPPGAPAPTMKSLDQVQPRTPISSVPFVISVSGSYYLIKSLTGIAGDNGITITADDVTLDLNGFALVGVPNSLYGIAAGAVKNLAIRNGVVRNWGENGVDASSAASSQFESLRLASNSNTGLYVGLRSIVTSCTATDNSLGIRAGDDSIITTCVASQNKGSGISVDSGATLTACNASHNATGYGISAGNGANIGNCNAFNNGADGIDTGVVAKVSRCVAAVNGRNGINVGDHALVDNCHVNGNGTAGNGTDHTLYPGIRVTNLSIVRECTSDYQGNSYGISVTGTKNRIEANNVTRNYVGIWVGGGANNLVIRNSASGNAFDYDTFGGSVGPIVTSANIATNANPSANYSY